MRHKIRGLRRGRRMDIYVAHNYDDDNLFKKQLKDGDIVEYSTCDGHELTLVMMRAHDTYHMCNECAFGDRYRFLCPRHVSGACITARSCLVYRSTTDVMEEL